MKDVRCFVAIDINTRQIFANLRSTTSEVFLGECYKFDSNNSKCCTCIVAIILSEAKQYVL